MGFDTISSNANQSALQTLSDFRKVLESRLSKPEEINPIKNICI